MSQLYPEYYILKVNDFNKVAKTPLEEWIYYLNTGEIPETAHAPGLAEVRERLKVDGMTKGEREAYYRHLDNIVILRNNIYTERAEGRAEGRMEGRAEGRMEGRAEGEHAKALEIAHRLKAMGLSVDVIIGATGLSAEEIEKA